MLPQRADRRGFADEHHGPARMAGQDPLLLTFAGVIRVMSGHEVGEPGHAPARVLLGQPGDPDGNQPDGIRVLKKRLEAAWRTKAAWRSQADRRRPVPPDAAIRFLISRASVGVEAWVSTTVSVPSASSSARSASELILTRIAAWRLRPSGRAGNAASPPRKCQRRSIVCSHVPVPTAPPAQQAVLRDHSRHARYVWNLAVEQHSHWRPGRKGAPGYLEKCRQLTAARAGHPWLAAGSQTVQQQALRDFTRAMAAFFDRPTGRAAVVAKAGATRDSGSSGAAGSGMSAGCPAMRQVWVPKAGWVRFRWSRDVPEGAKSYRVTMDRAGAGTSPSR